MIRAHIYISKNKKIGKMMNEQMSESDRKRTLYVGGVSEKMTEETLKAAFIAFGDIKDVQIPLDMASGKFCDAERPQLSIVALNVFWLV